MDVFGYKEKELQYYVLGNIVVIFTCSKMFLSFMNNVEQGEVLPALLRLLTGASVIGAMVYIYTFLLCSLIGGDTKIKLAYFSIGKPSGFTIFTEIRKGPKDMRIDREAALNKYAYIYGSMPDDTESLGSYENIKWYDIYHKYRNESVIKASNREFLAFRDMTVMTIPLCAVYLLTVALKIANFYWYVILLFVVELVFTNVAMRKKCERLVKNVIAMDLREK